MKQIVLIAALVAPLPLHGQAANSPINVFLDCNRCDFNFVRTEITYVNWVRDRTVADVHVLVSNQNTGGGGNRYTVTFSGLRRFAGQEDTLSYVTRTDETNDQVRRALTRTLAIGLVPYVASTPAGVERLRISWAAETPGATAAAPQEDPWNFWVFTVRLNSNFSGEESQRFLNWEGRLQANRVTEHFKTELELQGSFDEATFKINEAGGPRDITAKREYYAAEALAVRSLGQHWSVGVESEANQATFANIDFAMRGGPALEYSFWPYVEATRRSLVFRYSVGVRSHDYIEPTIYDKSEETHPIHSLLGELSMRQRWGSMSAEARYSQYLHDTQFHNLFTRASANVRLFKGFSVNFFASYSRVRDQLSLPKAELTPEQILLRQQELSTGYRYNGGVGISYSFGSIFNNVVNPRFN